MTGGALHHGYELGDEPTSVRTMLDGQGEAWVTHLVLRVTYLPDTARCTSGDRLRVPEYMVPEHIPQDEADEFEHSLAIKCYMDVRVNDHVLSAATSRSVSRMTVMIVRWLYWPGEYPKADDLEAQRRAWQRHVEQSFSGREHIVFIGPPLDISSEAWRFLGYWDVQKQWDGAVIAVHPGRDDWRSRDPEGYSTHRGKLEMALPDFVAEVTTAHQDRLVEYSGRIGPEEDLPMLVDEPGALRQYMEAVGAYADGRSPAQPPPPIDPTVETAEDARFEAREVALTWMWEEEGRDKIAALVAEIILASPEVEKLPPLVGDAFSAMLDDSIAKWTWNLDPTLDSVTLSAGRQFVATFLVSGTLREVGPVDAVDVSMPIQLTVDLDADPEQVTEWKADLERATVAIHW